MSAKDKATGKEQEIRIEASSGLSKEEIERMKAEAEANADADKKERERIDKVNQADSMIFQTENFLNDNKDKIPADDKPAIDAAIEALKKAKDSGDIAQIDAAIDGLNKAMQAASQKMYAAGGAGQQPGAGFQGGAQPNEGTQSNGADDVQDADFEEVK